MLYYGVLCARAVAAPKNTMNDILMKNYFTVFGLNIYYYAICIVSGILFAAFAAIPLFKRRGFTTDLLLDVLIAIVPCSIVFARLWYVLFDLDEFHSFYDVINLRSGGMAIYGGVLGGAVGLLLVSLIKKASFGRLCDIGAAMLPLGQAIGRLGNYFNQEVYGKAVLEPSLQHFPYAVFIEETGLWHRALFFYELVANAIVFIILYTLILNYKGRRNGYFVALYFFAYGLIRSIMEPMREETFNMGSPILGLPLMSWVGILICLSGAVYFTVLLILDIREKNYWWKDTFLSIASVFKKKSSGSEAEDSCSALPSASVENAARNSADDVDKKPE